MYYLIKYNCYRQTYKLFILTFFFFHSNYKINRNIITVIYGAEKKYGTLQSWNCNIG